MFMKKSTDREILKERMKSWIGSHPGYDGNILFDAAILETFFYIYNGLDNNMTIHEIGKELGVLPLA